MVQVGHVKRGLWWSWDVMLCVVILHRVSPLTPLGAQGINTMEWKKSEEVGADRGLESDTPRLTLPLAHLSPLSKMMGQRPGNVASPYALKENKLDLVDTWDHHRPFNSILHFTDGQT